MVSGGLEETRRRSAELFGQMAATADGSAERQQVREQLVHLHLPLAAHAATRFRDRGEPFDDLLQVGTIGLIKAIDRFDDERGVEFSTYALPTILGEIKRYFRDKGWTIRVPRRLQELRLSITAATAQLSQDLGRAPTPSELAQHLELPVSEVIEGIESSNAYSTLSLDAGSDDDDAPSIVEVLGAEDPELTTIEIRESIKPLIAALEPRERRILLLRFFRNMTQSQIAADIGVSQMHVSRLLNRTLAQLREGLDAAPDRAGRQGGARLDGRDGVVGHVHDQRPAAESVGATDTPDEPDVRTPRAP